MSEYFHMAGRVLKEMPGGLAKLMGEVARAEVPEEAREAAKDPANRLGKFIRVSAIARGGGGDVYRAWDEPLGRWVALKFPHLNRDQDRLRFLREANMAAGLSHPNLVPVYEVVDDPGRPFIALQFIEGQTLAKVRLTPSEAAEAIREATGAVSYAHRHGVIHRDLKPQNMMMDDEGHIYLLDFGLAKWLEPGSSLTPGENVLGTPAYMSPEQASGRRADERSDVYGLGATLYELVTGQPPFEGSSPAAILKQVQENDPIPPRQMNRRVPKDLATVIMKAMEKEAGRRYSTAEGLGEDLQRYLKGEPIRARPPSLLYRTRRRLARHRVAAGLAGSLVVVLIMAMAAISHEKSEQARMVAGVEAGNRARVAYAAGEIERALKHAKESKQLTPEYAIGYFWEGRCLLKEYIREQGLPSAWIYEGTIVFEAPSGPREERLEKLRADANAAFGAIQSREEKGLQGWETDCAKGIEALLEGQYHDAEHYLSQAHNHTGADLEVVYFLSQAQYYQGKFDEGKRSLEVLERVGFRPPQVELARARMLQGLGLNLQLQGADPIPYFVSAIGILNSTTSQAPELTAARAVLVLNWARYLMSRGRPDEALVKFNRSIEECAGADADHPLILEVKGEALVLLAELEDGRGQRAEADRAFDDAFACFDRAIELSNGFARARAKKGRALSRLVAALTARGEFAAAVKFAQDAIAELQRAHNELSRRGHQHPDLLLILATVRGFLEETIKGQTPQAFESRIDALNKVVQRWPDHGRAVLFRGIEQGRFALWLSSSDPPRAKELYMKAIEDCGRAVEINPKSAEAFHRRGGNFMRLGNHMSRAGVNPSSEYNQALEDMNRSLELNPMEASYVLHRAELWIRMVELDSGTCKNGCMFQWIARAEAERATQINKESSEAYYMLGMAHSHLGEYYSSADPVRAGIHFTRARNDFDTAIRLDPSDIESHYRRGNAWFNLAFVTLESPEEEEARYKKAIAEFTISISRNWCEAECYLSRGRANLQIGEYQKGYDDLKEAFKRNPELGPEVRSLLRRAAAAIRNQQEF